MTHGSHRALLNCIMDFMIDKTERTEKAKFKGLVELSMGNGGVMLHERKTVVRWQKKEDLCGTCRQMEMRKNN